MPDLRGHTGILPSQWLRAAQDHGVIVSPTYTFEAQQIQPASVDLRLGDWAYRLQCSFLPGPSTVKAKLSDYAMERIDLRDGAVLERNRPYLIPLAEELRLPSDLAARANPKSSTGRADIFTRVITDRGAFFDEVRRGYHGPLYLEVVSRSFTIRVRTGLRLNQLRLIAPGPSLSGAQLLTAHNGDPMVLLDGQPLFQNAQALGTNRVLLSLALDDPPTGQFIGWRA